MKGSRLNSITILLLYVCFCTGILFLIIMPIHLLTTAPSFAPGRDVRYYVYVACWECGTACILIIIHTLIRMMKTIGADPFIMKNVRYLKRMGIVALILVAFTLLAFVMYFMPMILIIAMMELMCALFALVLRDVFEKAVEYREENSLTI